MLERFSEQREEDAKNLLREILVENTSVIETQKKLEESFTHRTVSPTNKRQKSISPSTNNARKPPSLIPVPLLNFEPPKNLKPTLMGKTIEQLERKEKLKQASTEALLKDLEYRAKAILKPPIENPHVKLIKPFTSFINLQNPSKLRTGIDRKPFTYQQQLAKHQSVPTKPTISTEKQMMKLYGTKRVPGLYKGYNKGATQKPKTYTETLKSLKPTESRIKFEASEPVVKNKQPI